MSYLIQFAVRHQTVILLAVGWLFSAAMSTMPPLNANAGWWTCWIYRFAQAVAANMNKQHDTGSNGKTAVQ